MSNPTRVAVKPGQTAPRASQDTTPVQPVVARPNWFRRSWNRIKGWFRSSASATARFIRWTWHGIVYVWDYTIARITMLAVTVGRAIWSLISWVIGLPLRILGFIRDNNSHKVATELVQERQLNRAERRAAVKARQHAATQARIAARQRAFPRTAPGRA